MKISLVIATLGREKELYKLFNSLEKQTYKNFEIIVVDQNKDDRVKKCIERFSANLDVKHIKSYKKGISYNRNIGLKNISGNIIAFTDDDCIYDVNILNNVIEDFKKNKNVDAISYEIIDKELNKKLSVFPQNEEIIRHKNMFNCIMSATVFIKFKKISDIYFDEEFGVGSKYGSCEDSDFVYRLIKERYVFKFIPKSLIFHPSKIYPNEIGFSYGVGLGAFVKKTIVFYKSYGMMMFFLNELIRSIGGIILRPKRRKYYFNVLKGRIVGFIRYK